MKSVKTDEGATRIFCMRLPLSSALADADAAALTEVASAAL